MSYAKRVRIDVTTASDGSATVYSSPVNGLLDKIEYVKAGSGNFTDGVDFTITDENTGQSLWTEQNVNASTVRAPRQATHAGDGTAALYAVAGAAVLDRTAIADSRIKVVIASGGDTKTGTFWVTLV